LNVILISCFAAVVILARIKMIPRRIDVSNKDDEQFAHGNDGESAMEGHVPLPSAVPGNSTLEEPDSSAVPRNGLVRTDESNAGTAYASLSSLTTFNSQRPVPRNVASMLSHWSPGVNPDDYDWQRMTQALENEEAQRSNPTTPKRRLRKKPSKGAGLDSPARLPDSSAVPVVRQWGSQPDNEPPRLRLHSSQAMEEDLPMTQVERGIFGGREAGKKPAVKARKKKRAAGF
jgi:RNA polymerase I-specific transcription initiation factor RRN6